MLYQNMQTFNYISDDKEFRKKTGSYSIIPDGTADDIRKFPNL